MLTPEELAAYADGELEGAEAARALLAVAASPELMRLVQRHRMLRERIGAEFAPILDQEVPERLAALLRAPGEGTWSGTRQWPETGEQANAACKEAPLFPKRLPVDARGSDPDDVVRTRPYRGWLLLPALAAALAAAISLPGVTAGAAATEEPAGHATSAP